MSLCKAKIVDIQSIDSLNIVSFEFSNIKLKMMSLELSNKVQIQTNVILGVKPTNIALAKEFIGFISYSNQINSKVIDIKKGKLLSSISLQAHSSIFESIITTSSLDTMNINIGDNLIAFIKASDLFIEKLCDD